LETKVKICGITNIKDAEVAVEAGADLLGFIFFEPSPRYINPEAVGEIVSGIKRKFPAGRSGQSEGRGADKGNEKWQAVVEPARRAGRPTFIGVFVNASVNTIEHVLDHCQLDAAQLHGDEPPGFVEHFGNRAFKALRPKSPAAAHDLVERYAQERWPTFSHRQVVYLPALLIDAYHPTLYGGTGQVTDWTMAATIARSYPILLAGSLTPANVTEAIRAVQPWGVDASSGVEMGPGKKDHAKVRQFIRAAKKLP
jgi:phosphoribosylanthranilate isomerase